VLLRYQTICVMYGVWTPFTVRNRGRCLGRFISLAVMNVARTEPTSPFNRSSLNRLVMFWLLLIMVPDPYWLLTFQLLFWTVADGCTVDSRLMARAKPSRIRVTRREIDFMTTDECGVDKRAGWQGAEVREIERPGWACDHTHKHILGTKMLNHQ